MKEKNQVPGQVMGKEKRAKYSIRSKIIATAVCPLLAMSTAVSILAVNGVTGIAMANVIAAILFVGVVQLLYVSNGIVKSVRMADDNRLEQLYR